MTLRCIYVDKCIIECLSLFQFLSFLREKINFESFLSFSFWQRLHCSTVCIMDLAKLNLIWWFDLRLEPIFLSAQLPQKYDSLQMWSKLTRKINLLFSTKNKSKFLIYPADFVQVESFLFLFPCTRKVKTPFQPSNCPKRHF